MPYSAAEQSAAAASVRPILWARLSVNHTKKTCAVSCLVPIIALLVVVISGRISIDNPVSQDYVIRNDERTRLYDARRAAMKEFRYKGESAPSGGGDPPSDVGDTPTEVQVAERTNEDGNLELSILFRGRVGVDGDTGVLDETSDQANNVLTTDGLALMKKAEDVLLNSEDYQKYCLRDPDFTDCQGKQLDCVVPKSVLLSDTLYGIYREDNGKLCGRENDTKSISDDEFTKFRDSLLQKNGNETRVDPFFAPFVGTDFSFENRTTWIAQSVFRFGRPFKGYKNLTDNPSQQTDEYEKWAAKVSDSIRNLTTPNIDVFLIGSTLIDASFGEVVLRDLSFSIAAIVLVFIVIWFHTSSLFLASTAMGQIFLAFPFAYVFYTFIFRQEYFAALQILVVFLILGIGADDVFVFTDAWKQSAVVLGQDCDLVTRMSWTYRRSVRAMSVTSFTTAAAFFVTAGSPIMPVSTLGIWAGILILLQFVLVITIYPCAVVIWHRFWRVRSSLKCFRKPTEQDLNAPHISFWQRCLPEKWRGNPAAAGEYRMIERFFRGPWTSFVHRARYILVVLALVLVGVSIWLATRLEPPEEQENFLPKDNELRIAFTALQDAFPRNKASFQLRVYITWGIKDVNREETSRFDPSEPGKVVLDETFDFTSAAAQRHVLKTCEFFGKQENLIFREPTIPEPVDCWIQDFKKWRATRGHEDFEDYPSDEDFIEELEKFGKSRREGGSQPYLKYLTGQRIAFTNDSKRIVFTEISFVSPIEDAVPYKRMWPVYNEWQDQLKKRNEQAPESVKNSVNKAIATGGYSWLWQITQITLVRSMFVGTGIMLLVALGALIASTFNWAISVLATFCIGAIVAMLLGIVYLLGWELGISESIGVVIAVGYSFDAVAHISVAYIESKHSDRYERTKDALTDLGISILFGVITTLLAGFMLFPATIIFFVKFAGLIVSTVSLGLVWSLIFLPAILLVTGPTGDFGSVAAIFRKIVRWSRRQEADAVKYVDTSS